MLIYHRVQSFQPHISHHNYKSIVQRRYNTNEATEDMARVPLVGRLFFREYVALYFSFMFLIFEFVIRIITLALRECFHWLVTLTCADVAIHSITNHKLLLQSFPVVVQNICIFKEESCRSKIATIHGSSNKRSWWICRNVCPVWISSGRTYCTNKRWLSVRAASYFSWQRRGTT